MSNEYRDNFSVPSCALITLTTPTPPAQLINDLCLFHHESTRRHKIISMELRKNMLVDIIKSREYGHDCGFTYIPVALESWLCDRKAAQIIRTPKKLNLGPLPHF